MFGTQADDEELKVHGDAAETSSPSGGESDTKNDQICSMVMDHF